MKTIALALILGLVAMCDTTFAGCGHGCGHRVVSRGCCHRVVVRHRCGTSRCGNGVCH